MNLWSLTLFRAFIGLWRANAGAVHAEYLKLGESKALLADIANRAGLYAAEFIDDPRKAAWHEGRRALALEILTLAKADADQLRQVSELIQRTGK